MEFRSISDIAAEGQANAAALTAVNAARQQYQVNVPVYQAKGKALADLAISEARGQGSAWTRFYRDMLGLETEGRKAFRTTIAAHQKAMQSHVKARKQYEELKRTAILEAEGITAVSAAALMTKLLQLSGGAILGKGPFEVEPQLILPVLTKGLNFVCILPSFIM